MFSFKQMYNENLTHRLKVQTRFELENVLVNGETLRVRLVAEPAEQSGVMLAKLLIKTNACKRKHCYRRNDTKSLPKVQNNTVKLRK